LADCNGRDDVPTTSCAYNNKDRRCDAGTEPLTCAEALRLRPNPTPPDGKGCAAFGCKDADAHCSPAGVCETPSGPVCVTKPSAPTAASAANYPRACNVK